MRGFVFAVCAFAITIESILFGTHANLGVFGHLEIESLLHLAIVLFIDKKKIRSLCDGRDTAYLDNLEIAIQEPFLSQPLRLFG